MKKIDLSKYMITFTKDGVEQSSPFNVKDSIVELLFIPHLKLNGTKLLEQYELAEKIKKSEDFILLEDAEYEKVKHSFEVYDQFDKNGVELVRRVLEAETVDAQSLVNKD